MVKWDTQAEEKAQSSSYITHLSTHVQLPEGFEFIDAANCFPSLLTTTVVVVPSKGSGNLLKTDMISLFAIRKTLP